MALVTWEDIGSTLQQAEDNINQGNVPSEQGFPYSSSWGSYSILSSYDETFKEAAITHLKSGIFYGKTLNTVGAVKTGALVTANAARIIRTSPSYNYNNLISDIYTWQVEPTKIPDLWSVIKNSDTFGGFVLRIPVRFKRPDVVLPVFVLLYSNTVANGNPRVQFGYGAYTLINGTTLRNGGDGRIYPLANPFRVLLEDDADYEVSDNVKANLAYLLETIRIRGYDLVAFISTTFDVNANDFPNYTLNRLVNSTPSATQRSDYYSCAMELVYSDFPVWDISNNVALDVVNYIQTGAIANTWYHQSGEYEPAISSQVSDTTTIWNVQALRDVNPTYRINYYNTVLGTSSAAVRRQWRGNIFVDSWRNADGTEVRSFSKSDIVLYDKPYVNHAKVFSIKYSELYDKVLQFVYSNMGDGSYQPASSDTWLGNTWLSNNMAYIFRIGLCIYTSNQISNIVYVDIKYDSTNGLSWGVLKDYGDDSEVHITIVSDTSIESAGGETKIPIVSASDGYTGTLDEVSSSDDYTYDPEGSGEVPTDTITPVSNNGISIGGKFCTTYQVTTAQLKAISDYFWNDGSTGFMSKYINAVNNPIESILSVGYMPIEVTDGVGSDSVFIGNVNLTAQDANCVGYTVGDTTRKVVIGTLEIPEIYNSFLDYQPYTSLTIFLPYIGYKTLPPNMFMGKELKVEYAFDLVTGACKALLSADGKFVLSFDGDSMIKIPLTASNNSDVFMQRLRSAVEAGVNILSAGVGSVATTSGGAKTVSGERFSRSPSAAGKGYSMKRTSVWDETTTKEPTTYHSHAYGGAVSQVVGAGLDIAMAKHTYETYGGASSATASTEPMSVFVIIDSPVVQYPSTYNHNCGKPCELSKYLSSLTGYTEVDGGIDLSGIPCTDAERSEILSLLAGGVYL